MSILNGNRRDRRGTASTLSMTLAMATLVFSVAAIRPWKKPSTEASAALSEPRSKAAQPAPNRTRTDSRIEELRARAQQRRAQAEEVRTELARLMRLIRPRHEAEGGRPVDGTCTYCHHDMTAGHTSTVHQGGAGKQHEPPCGSCHDGSMTVSSGALSCTLCHDKEHGDGRGPEACNGERRLTCEACHNPDAHFVPFEAVSCTVCHDKAGHFQDRTASCEDCHERTAHGGEPLPGEGMMDTHLEPEDLLSCEACHAESACDAGGTGACIQCHDQTEHAGHGAQETEHRL